jgi:hypothetical protein
MKLLEEYVGEMPQNIGMNKDFFWLRLQMCRKQKQK